MTRRRKIVFAKGTMVIVTLPFLMWAYEYGPDPGYVAVPGENGGATCATSGCHTGTANNPANKGGVTINFPNGTSYLPGVAETLSVTVSDPAATQKAAGFELTIRKASSTATMAGGFAANDANTQVVCSEPNLQVFNQGFHCEVRTRQRCGRAEAVIAKGEVGYAGMPNRSVMKSA